MFFYLRGHLLRLATSNSTSRMRRLYWEKLDARYFLNRRKFSLIEETPETSSTSHTSAVTREQGMHSMATARLLPLKSFSRYTKLTPKNFRFHFQNRLSKRRVPSRTAHLVYKLYAPKASQRGRAIMDYSTLASILRGPSPELGKTSWWSTTSNMWLPLSRIMNCKSLSNKSARKTTNTNAKTRPSTASAIRAYVERANLASEERVLMRLK